MHEKQIDDYWSGYYGSDAHNDAKAGKLRSNWWHSDYIISRVNSLVSGVDSPIPSEGLNMLLLKQLNGKRLKTGVSVGFGDGAKEFRLLELGAVDKFLLFELSAEAVDWTKKRVIELNLCDRVEVHHADAFKFDFSNYEIELVHWNNSLHHMFDVDAAVKWSRDLLSPGGVFYMDDYVGANRFQFPQHVLDIVTEVRGIMPAKYLKYPYGEGYAVKQMFNVPLASMEADPSEAADSEKILESVKKYFPQAQIKLTGGLVYFLAINALICNFDESLEEDLESLEALMNIDKLYTQHPGVMSLYAVALAIKHQ